MTRTLSVTCPIDQYRAGHLFRTDDGALWRIVAVERSVFGPSSTLTLER